MVFDFRSVRLQHRLFSKLRAQNMLLEMLTSSLEKDEESFILIVEAICALCRFIGLNVHLECGTGAVLVSREGKDIISWKDNFLKRRIFAIVL